MRSYFVIHLDRLSILDDMTDEQAGKLFKAIKAFQLDEPYEMDLLTKVAFNSFKPQMQADIDRYNHICERNRNNGKKGGRPKEPNETQETQVVILETQENPEKPRETQEGGNTNTKTNTKTKTKTKTNIDIIDNNISETTVSVSPHPEEDVDCNMVALYFNQVCGQYLPKIQKVTDTRRKAIRCRCNEYGKKAIKQVIDMTVQSDFLTGRSGSWNGCSFDWIFAKSNFIKILEGNYENKSNSVIQSADDKRRSFAEGLTTARAILAQAAEQDIPRDIQGQ